VPKAYLWTRFAAAASGLRAIAMPAITSAKTPGIEMEFDLPALQEPRIVADQNQNP
jgi:hypothetical protein